MTSPERCPLCERLTGETIGLLCRLRLHAWTRWTDREESTPGLFGGEIRYLRRMRECLRCGLMESGDSRLIQPRSKQVRTKE